MYGTGWVPGYQNVKPNEAYNNPAPPYTPNPVPNQYTGNTFNSNDGYYGQRNQQNYGYGGQQNGIELQTPQQSYQRGGDNVYTPPSGPPPGK